MVKKISSIANVLDGENVNLGKLESAYKSLSKEIYANAVARSYADKIADISIKKDQELIKAQNQYVSYLNAQKTLDKAIA